MVALQPLPPVLLPFHIRGAGRPRGRGRQQAAPVTQNVGMVQHRRQYLDMRQEPGGGNLPLIEDHHLLGNIQLNLY